MKNPRITQEEIEIIKRAQAGDILAFNKLFAKYKPFVDNILYGYIKDTDEAKDITNVVFLKVYDKLSLFKDYSSFGGWLRILTNRTAIDYLREVNKHEVVQEDSYDRLPYGTSVYHAEDELVNQLTYDTLLHELKKLPEPQKSVCMLFYKDNMPVSTISKKLSIPIGTIKSILFRMRKQIRKHFKQL